MKYLSISFLLLSQFFFLANASQIMVEIEPNWKILPEYRSLLEPEQYREVFQSNRFEVQIYKEGIQEGISIAGTRVAKDRDIFRFESIPEDWMEPTRVVLEIKLPPILSVTKLLLNEESFYQPRIRRPFHILRKNNINYRDNLIYKFTILEYPERIFRHDIQLPMGETPTGGNEVAYMELLNRSVTKLEQSGQLCAQTKYECNLNLLLKYTHVERQFDGFFRAVTNRKLTISTQNFTTIKAKSKKLFTDIMKLAMVVLEEEKKIFKENASSSIDLYHAIPTVPILHLHSQHQHGLDSSQSSHTQTPTSGTTSSAAAAGALPLDRKIAFKLMTIEKIAQVLSGLDPSRIPQQSQINIPAGTNQERMKFIMSDFLSPNSLNSGQFANIQAGQQQQEVVGQTSRGGPSAGQTKEKGKEKVANVVQPTTNVEAISSSEENDPPNPIAAAGPILTTADKVGQKRKHPSENVPVAVDVEKKKSINEPRVIGDPEKKILWRHLVKFEDIWTSTHDPSDRDAHGDERVAEEQRERFKLTDELGIEKFNIYRWLFRKKGLLNTNNEKTRREFESEKKKYQSEMAATGGGSAGASKIPSAAANEKTSNVEVISSSEETDPNPMAVVPAGPIPNDPINARPLNWMPPADDNQQNKKQKYHSTEIGSVDALEKRAKQRDQGARFDDRQRAALWRHFVQFEDIWATDHPAEKDRQFDEKKERFKLERLLGLTNSPIYHWLYSTKDKLSKNVAIIREQFEIEKKKYQSEMAAKIGGGKDKASASASAPAEVQSNVDLNLNLNKSNTDEEGDKMQED